MGRRVYRANTATHHHLPASSTVLYSYINARTYSTPFVMSFRSTLGALG